RAVAAMADALIALLPIVTATMNAITGLMNMFGFGGKVGGGGGSRIEFSDAKPGAREGRSLFDANTKEAPPPDRSWSIEMGEAVKAMMEGTNHAREMGEAVRDLGTT